MYPPQEVTGVGGDQGIGRVLIAGAPVVADETPIRLGVLMGVVQHREIVDDQDIGPQRHRLQHEPGPSLAKGAEGDWVVVQEAIERHEVRHR